MVVGLHGWGMHPVIVPKVDCHEGAFVFQVKKNNVLRYIASFLTFENYVFSKAFPLLSFFVLPPRFCKIKSSTHLF